MDQTTDERRRVADALRTAADHMGPAGERRTHDGFCFRPTEAPTLYAIAEQLLRRGDDLEAGLKRLRAAAAQAAAKHGINLNA